MPTLDPADPLLSRRLQRLRQNPVAAYAIAIAAVLIATIVRWLLADYLPQGLPFITYFIAVAVAARLGLYRFLLFLPWTVNRSRCCCSRALHLFLRPAGADRHRP